MSKKRIRDLSKELNVENKRIIDFLSRNGYESKTPASGLDEAGVALVEKHFKKPDIANQTPKKVAEAPKADAKGTPKTAEQPKKQDAHKTSTHKGEGRKQESAKAEAHKGSGQGHKGTEAKQENRNQKHGNKPAQRQENRQENKGQERNMSRNADKKNETNNRNDRPERSNDRPERSNDRPERSNDHSNDRKNNRETRNNKETRGNRDGNNNNDRRNKKDKKNRNGNRPQSLLSTSLAKSKNRVKQRNEQNRQHKEEEKRKAEAMIATHIEIGQSLTVKELAETMGREVSEIIKKLMLLGVMATINQEIDFETAAIVAEEFGVSVSEAAPEEDPTEVREIEDSPESLQPRPPVVTIMGHVDHGKTSLLDVIRQTNVTASEAGGITQHIGAYMVRYKGNKITFLDTPGHEAFTAMRLRGAQSTDIAVLVVAADDGVMPQTIEAINHAKSANVPIIVAINKMDKPGANPDHVKQQLAEHGLLPEEWGGDIIMVPVSAKQRQGIDDLLENILLVAEVMELKANPNRNAQGVVIEAKLDKGRGPVCTVLVQKGSLRVGDNIIAGVAYGKVRAMTNERGEKVKVARPSMPVEVLGLSDVPQAGEIMDAVDDNEARAIAESRVEKQRMAELGATHKVTLDDIFNQIQQGELKDLNIIIKADVQGSVEALRQSLEAIKNPEVRIVIVHAAVGAINESDVMLASASNAIIIGFNVRPDAVVRKAAEKESVDLRTYRVIYDAINDVESAMRGMLTPEFKEVILGRAEVRQVISTPKAIVAGSYITEGKITNKSEIRLIRDGVVVHEGQVDSLRRFKDEVKEVKSGFECGISIERYRDIKEGDIIEAFMMEEIAPQI
ncbi:translation initiation factor IF-2 [Veillonella criceti]|uniref:Translation initiation factor IF-2 n=1 Tax=Veillonella criceti TaxID=103891 RepID=A0A380NGD4_9FIRM|nr:translation initiation factor IF-2 [Veillonella criceti]SUP40431.1 Translation initiation factor IF-2 [Veillonella criceti]